MAKTDDLLGAADAADLLGIGRRHILNLIAGGLLPAKRVGNAFIIRRVDLAKVPKVRKRGPKVKGK